MLFSNCSIFCSLFIGDNHKTEAFKCYQKFAVYDPKKAGMILEGYDLIVYFLGLPDDLDSSNVEDIMTSMPPYISIEPMINIYSYFKYINKLVAGHLIISQSFVKYFDNLNVLPFDDELEMLNNAEVLKLTHIEPSISNFPQLLSF